MVPPADSRVRIAVALGSVKVAARRRCFASSRHAVRQSAQWQPYRLRVAVPCGARVGSMIVNDLVTG
jgi:hypothetical protein